MYCSNPGGGGALEFWRLLRLCRSQARLCELKSPWVWSWNFTKPPKQCSIFSKMSPIKLLEFEKSRKFLVFVIKMRKISQIFVFRTRYFDKCPRIVAKIWKSRYILTLISLSKVIISAFIFPRQGRVFKKWAAHPSKNFPSTHAPPSPIRVGTLVNILVLMLWLQISLMHQQVCY